MEMRFSWLKIAILLGGGFFAFQQLDRSNFDLLWFRFNSLLNRYFLDFMSEFDLFLFW
ncbi:hypothetical protein K7G90_000888 [Pasteurella canis]|uniref:Uncharacterized protein n=1 Tax=Pasteurella canis TaxID=753 RepID=A0A379ET13_9PAST|nr:hypothetical protein [Pasteurella canis]MXN87954.1 hypothetical protein [Pasteurella canis]UAX43069.1 hypothetical protein K7G89_000935 [Pasteurella canis]UAY78581.1 hypothetical protein K7G90_000888 [Pasteurella canis]UEA17820.1 hypothetical protein K7G92_001051 [Pasteurella canis]UEC24194.1 hypothetical protein K7G93_000979 [Pasteurella canis]